MTGRTQVRVLGPLQVERAGRELPVGSPSQRRLLTALVMAGGATVSADRLIDVLWADAPPPAARNSLQSHVARLRAALDDPDAIVTRAPGYAVATDLVEVDAATFERLLRDARRDLDDDPRAAAAALTDALTAWRGHAYAEFADDLARDEAVRLERLRSDAQRLLAEARLRSGDATGAVEAFAGLVAAEPLREDVVSSLAEALVAAGRPVEALEALRAFRSRLGEELGLDPSTAFDELEQRILRGEAAPPAQPSAPVASTTARRGTPTPPPRVGTPTVGRDGAPTRILDAVGSAPLVTLVGPGGVGKTRLAAVAVGAAAPGPGGEVTWDGEVAWADLSRVTYDGGALPGILDAIGTVAVDPDDVEAVATALARFDGIVVLDNCEHLLAPVADLVDRALRAAGPVRFLATSRERFDIDGEQVVPVEPLPVPDPDVATEQDPAVALFCHQLASVGGGAVGPAAAARVASAVDGLPLAIELAASRVATLGVDGLLDRLADHLDVLTSSGRRHGDRQRTLTGVIASSHDLLPERDRTVFRRLAVFASVFGLADAERVCADEGVPVGEVADALASLVERSMVTAVGDGRFRLLEPLRVFARDELARADDADTTELRHRDLMLELAARADAGVTGPDESAVVAEVEAALPDLRAAYSRALARDDLGTVARLSARLYRFAYLQGRFDMLAWGAGLADRSSAAIDEDDRLRAIAAGAASAAWRGDMVLSGRLVGLYGDRLDDERLMPWTRVMLAETLGDLAIGRGELSEVAGFYGRQYELAGRLGHDGLASMATAGASTARAFQGRSQEAIDLAREATELAERSGAPTARSLAAYALGEATADVDPDAALDAFDLAIAQAMRVNARFYEGIARTADVALRGRHGDPDEALARYDAALQVWSDAGADGLVVTTLRNLVVLLARIGVDRQARTLFRALDRLAARDSYGAEADRLRAAADAVNERLDPAARIAADRDAADLGDLASVSRFGREAIRAAREGQRIRSSVRANPRVQPH